jgi:hypothetical protein
MKSLSRAYFFLKRCVELIAWPTNLGTPVLGRWESLSGGPKFITFGTAAAIQLEAKPEH